MSDRTSVITLGLLQAGCSTDIFNRDAEALDKFSRAYTDFRNAAYDAEIDLQLLASNVDPFGFYKELRRALDARGTNSSRLEHASTATALYDKAIIKALEVCGVSLDKMDRGVLQLVETANSIPSTEFRVDASVIAKAAREIHSAFGALHNLWAKRLRLQADVLTDITLDSGQMRATFLFRKRGDEATAITAEIETAARHSIGASQRLKDAFSAMKGKAKLKEYPFKEDADQKTQ